MKSADFNRAMVAAESWTEAALIWQAGLPTPLSFLLELLKYVACFVAGAWLL